MRIFKRRGEDLIDPQLTGVRFDQVKSKSKFKKFIFLQKRIPSQMINLHQRFECFFNLKQLYTYIWVGCKIES